MELKNGTLEFNLLVLTENLKMEYHNRIGSSQMINSTKYFSWGDIRGQNKNGTGSYSFSTANYNAGVCGKGYTLTQNITQGNTTYDACYC